MRVSVLWEQLTKNRMDEKMDAKEALKVYFGFDSYKEGQETAITAILEGRDVIAVMPTGSGKSICYQVPALVLPGMTIVVSPLISLMQDQVKELNNVGVHAGYINSSLSESQISKVYELAAAGKFKILYVAPERLENQGFKEFAEKSDISMVTVDEAHCISQWGQDFRPSYLKIIDFLDSLSKRPVVSAFTATATEEVKNDISCVLKLQDSIEVVTGFDRPNLYFSVEHVRKKDDFVVDHIKKHPEDGGIIYCATRKNVDQLYELLRNEGIPVTRYHAGMNNGERKQDQDDFIFDRIPVIIATNAFGMGINKSNVRFVIHYNMPQSMENYYQEAGRAGRDGEPAQCILLYSAQDIIIDRFLLEHKEFKDISGEDIELIKERDEKRLQIMEGYCKTTGCLRNYILNYFGEKPETPCDNCGNCNGDYYDVDMTDAAKQVINCIYETKGRYGLSIVIGTLLGADRARLKELRTNEYRSYGKLKNISEENLKSLIDQMLTDGYIYRSEGRYSVVKIGNIDPLKDDDTRVIVRIPVEKEISSVRKEKRRKTDSLTKAGYELFDKLKALRIALAREEGIPPYIVFSDKTLIDMCTKLPQNRKDMLNVSGVGEMKLEKYGQRFIDEISRYLNANPGTVISIRDDEEAGKEKVSKKKKTKTPKQEFYLYPKDAENFDYQDFKYVSEIKDEINRICSAENVKKATNVKILEFLQDQGYIEERLVNGFNLKTQTELGSQKGILTEEKISQAGNAYTVLRYPRNIQKEIVEHFTRNTMQGDDYER